MTITWTPDESGDWETSDIGLGLRIRALTDAGEVLIDRALAAAGGLAVAERLPGRSHYIIDDRYRVAFVSALVDCYGGRLAAYDEQRALLLVSA
ncbi:MAG: hypothetical protein U0990_09315 [Candidatus Nanopelagicales bacterium]|nr:hypothetical protein [Candidatus Nanopelagicales bacterium]